MARRAAGAWGARVLLGALLGTGAARAEELPAPPAPAAAAAPTQPPSAPAAAATPQEERTPGESTEECPAGAACEAGAPGPLQLRLAGRVFARARADERDAFARTLSIPSARLGLEAEWGLVSAEVSAELTGNNLLRDAWVGLRDEQDVWRLSAGQFKSPFMARVLPSSWKLPLVGRGLVEDYVVDTHHLGGRRPGLMVEARPEGAAKVRAALGVFRGERDDATQTVGEDVAARVTARPFKALTVGTSGYAAGVATGTRHWGAGGDVALKLHTFQLTAEVLGGQLPVGPFLSQSLLAWVDVPVGRTGLWTLQPLAGGEGLQLRGVEGAPAGQGWMVVGGVNALYGDVFKVLVQGERGLRPGDERPGTSVTLQLAVRLK